MDDVGRLLGLQDLAHAGQEGLVFRELGSHLRSSIGFLGQLILQLRHLRAPLLEGLLQLLHGLCGLALVWLQLRRFELALQLPPLALQALHGHLLPAEGAAEAGGLGFPVVALPGQLLHLHLQLVGRRVLHGLLRLLGEHAGDPPLERILLGLQRRHHPVLPPELLMQPLGRVQHLVPLLGQGLHLGLRRVQGLLERDALALQGGVLLLAGLGDGRLARLNGSAEALPLRLGRRSFLFRCCVGLPQLFHCSFALGQFLLHLLPRLLRRRPLRGLLRCRRLG
mmetsp:Transcript_64764/g.173515  ORF Transcript_64764/g.173515 Transcript_64764/m.173515 type:complete len:281 (+) Transcript_64764:1872-2714(+)